jgi:tetratricopeptide (TPR) repeat protein
MKKTLAFLRNRTTIKYLLLTIAIVLGITVPLVLYKNKPLTKIKEADHTAEIKRLTDIADVLFDRNQKDSAFIYYNKAKILCDPKTNTTDHVYALSNMAEIRQSQGNFTLSEAIITEALPYLNTIENPRYAWIVYNILGINYLNTYDFTNAILYFKKSIALKSSAWRKSLAKNNLAVVYLEQGKYKEAADLFLLLAQQKNTSKFDTQNNHNYAFIIDNLGYCYYKLGNPKALACYYEGLKIRLQPKNREGLCISYEHLSTYFLKSNPSLAKEYALKAYKKATATKAVSYQISSLSKLIAATQGNDLKQYTLKYIHLIDSVDLAQRKDKNQFANLKYISRQEKKENLQLKAQKIENELQLERQKHRNIISYIIIAFVIALITILCFYLISKGRKEKDSAIYKSEMRISKKLNHELSNDVYHTLLFAENNDLELPENKEQLLNNLDTLYFRTRNISKENSPIITDHNYSRALKEMISEFKTTDLNILLNGFDSISWNEINKNKKITLYRVLQELFLNMKKHSKATLVSLTFKIQNKNITINYIDNGVGFDDDNIFFKNGLQNVESRIKTINGTVIFDSNSKKGFKLSFDFPL